MSDTPAIAGYLQIPSNDKDRCPICGLRRAMIRKLLPKWKRHAVHPVRVLDLRDEGAKRGIQLYNKEDLLRVLNYEAEQQMNTNQTV